MIWSRINWKVRTTLIIVSLLLIFVGLVQRPRVKLETKYQLSRIKTEKEWTRLLKENIQEFKDKAETLLFLSDFTAIRFENVVSSAPCGENDISKCTPVFLKDGNSINGDEAYVVFMKKFNITFLEKNNFPALNVQFSSGDFGLCGLMFFPVVYELKEDAEFILVRQIDDHWYYFCRDWN